MSGARRLDGLSVREPWQISARVKTISIELDRKSDPDAGLRVDEEIGDSSPGKLVEQTHMARVR